MWERTLTHYRFFAPRFQLIKQKHLVIKYPLLYVLLYCDDAIYSQVQMKKYFFVAVGLLLLACFSHAGSDSKTDICASPDGQPEAAIPESTETRRTEALEQIRLMPPSTQVIGIGDSLIAGWPADLLQLPKKYNSYWNFGYPGDTTGNVLWRMAQAPLARLSPEKVLVLVGTNNLTMGQSACATVVGINSIVQAVQATWPRTRIAVLSIPPRGVSNSDYFPQRAEINAQLTLLSERGRFEFIQLPDEKLACFEKAAPCKYYQKDYLHLNRTGYALLNQHIQKFLER